MRAILTDKAPSGEKTVDLQFTLERIAATKLQIVAYEDAILALSNGVQSYSLDTGQSKQSVTRASIPDLQKALDQLYNRLATLTARVSGSGVTRVIPAW